MRIHDRVDIRFKMHVGPGAKEFEEGKGMASRAAETRSIKMAFKIRWPLDEEVEHATMHSVFSEGYSYCNKY